MAPMRCLGIVAFVCSLAGCVGGIGGGGDDEGGPDGNGPNGSDPQDTGDEVAISGLRRLTIAEYRQSVLDLVGMDPAGAREILPADTLAPFDNDYTLQTPSESLIKGAELLSGDVAAAIVADPSLRSSIVGCEPTGPADEACFRSFVETFGRRALRRTLDPEEVDRFVSLHALGVEAGDFWLSVEAALRAFLQHPEFLYRVEIGSPVAERPGVYELSSFELAARLSYLLIGSTTPDWLLDAAEAGELDDAAGLASATTELLEDPRAKDRIHRFHAMWLGYEQLSRTGVFGDMHTETNALIDRVVFEEGRGWQDLLTADETFVTPELAEHYGLPSPGSEPGWVSYEGTGRKGLLSHGTFLSAVPKFGDTSPTQRGLLVRARLFCQPIDKPPPELNVNVDMPPPTSDPNACKQERYFMADEPACAGCHQLMDPIGFGLETYDATGQYRSTEPNRPDCPLDGQGDFLGVGEFEGPAGLADRAVESGYVEECVAQQLYRFAVGRTELDEADMAILTRLAAQATTENGLELAELINSYVTSDAFRLRREEEAQ